MNPHLFKKGTFWFLDFDGRFTNLENGAPDDVSSAIKWANEKTVGGFDDWILPDRYTLALSALLVSSKEIYWSSTGYASYAWEVVFGHGFVVSDSRSDLNAVRLLRKSQQLEIGIAGLKISQNGPHDA